ncbi:MAG TPA: STAS domain-containing protein [Planctomycetes bacterium]|nr:STAS domain-containing protein [Planctomycetota bacterium]
MAAIDFKVRNVKSPQGATAAVAEVSGSIDATTINQFQTIMDKLVQKGVKNLVLDCTNVKYINSTGLGTLLKYVDTFSGVGGNLVFTRVPSKVMLVMEMLGFNALFSIYEEEDEALQFLGAGGAVAEAPAEAVAATPSPAVAPIAPVAPGKPKAPSGIAPKPPSGVAPKPAPAPPKVSFPMDAECSRCRQKMEIPGAGSFRCPRCAQICSVDGGGKVGFPATKLPAPVEVSVPATQGFAGVVAALAEGLAVTMGINSDAAEAVRNGIGSLMSQVVEASYNSDATSAINVLLIPTDKGLRTEIVDNGSGLDVSTVDTSADDVKVTPHPVKGSVYTLLYGK